MAWENESCIFLIELYKAQPVLWNLKHKQYLNKQKKEDAWETISKQMSCTAEDAKGMMSTLLARYTIEKTKHTACCRQTSGCTYISQWYAYDSFSFFPDHHELDCSKIKKQTGNNATNSRDDINDITWYNETCLSLIASYENHKVLWDRRHEHYHYKPAKDVAWDEISKEFECSVDVVKKKIASLTGSYRREKSRQKRSFMLGKPYTISWYAYDRLNCFLDNLYRIESDIPDTNMLSDENTGTATEVEDVRSEVTPTSEHSATSSCQMIWDRKAIISLIDLYRNNPVLWDDCDIDCSRGEKENAWLEISSKFACDVDEVKKKIYSLTGSYRREKSKQRRTSETGNGTKYVSRWFAFDRLNFLSEKCYSPVDTVDTNVELDNDARVTVHKNANARQESYPKSEFEGRKKRKRKRDIGLKELLKLVKKSENNPDYYLTFGQHIASELRKYDNETLACVKHAINNIVIETDLKISKSRRFMQRMEEPKSTSIRATNIFSASKSTVKIEHCDEVSEMNEDHIHFKNKHLKKRKNEDAIISQLIELLKKSENKSDFYVTFGQHIANELRKYDQITLACTKHSINDIIFKADLGKLNLQNYSNFNDGKNVG